jgi:hypothetical protein
MLIEEAERCPDEGRDRAPRRIGELLPEVLARYGIESDQDERRADSAAVVFVPMSGDFATGILEFALAR